MANANPPTPPDNTGKTYKTLKTFNPKADIFKQFFLNPTSATFMNVRASALRAGYSELYANNITVQKPKWWRELQDTSDFRRAQMLNKAESALYNTVAQETEDRDDKKLKHDAAKFISERLGKEHYSTRQELTDKGGRRLFEKETRETHNIPLSTLFKGVKQE